MSWDQLDLSAERSKEDTEKIATDLGLVCFFPTDFELTLDIDGELPGPEAHEKVLNILSDNGLTLQDELKTISKSGNWHLWYRISCKLPLGVRVAIQSILGSDPGREAWNIIRWRQGSEAPIALFETPSEAKKVEEWRSRP